EAPPRRRYLTLTPGYLLSKDLSRLPTMAPPVSVPYQTTSPSFFAGSREPGCAPIRLGETSETISSGRIIIRRRQAMIGSLRVEGLCGTGISPLQRRCKRQSAER